MLIKGDYDYYKESFINATAIKAGAISIRHMVACLNHQTEPSCAASLIRGTQMHSYIWNKADFDRQFKICDLDFRTKAGKEFLAENNIAASDCVKSDVIEEYTQAKKNVENHPALRALNGIFNIEPEKEIYWSYEPSDGTLPTVNCKARLDGLNDNYILEYKTTQNLDTFELQITKLHYYLQVAWYFEAVRQLNGKELPVIMVAQESKAPYDIKVIKFEVYQLREWLKECFRIVDAYLAHVGQPIEKINGRYNELMHFELPHWAECEADDDVDIEGI